MHIDWDVPITMDDGLTLRADVFLPLGNTRCPVILSYGAYAKGLAFQDGSSYYGVNQWHVASLKPPHLTAVRIWEGAADRYRDMTRHGGIVCTFWANWYGMQMKTAQYGLGEREPKRRVNGTLVCGGVTLSDKALQAARVEFGDEILAHPLDDQWLRASHRKLDTTLSLPYRPYHTHDEAQPLKPGAVVQIDIELRPTSIMVPAGYRIALTVRGRDYDYAKSTGARLSNFKNELRGCGPFLHDDRRDRPAAVFGGKNTLHFGATEEGIVLLPIVPNT
jgi:predicted acyl esterase